MFLPIATAHQHWWAVSKYSVEVFHIKNRLLRLLILSGTIAFAVAILNPAYASWGYYVSETEKIYYAVIGAGSIIALTWSGIKYLSASDSQASKKAMSDMIIVILAVLAFIFLPSVVQLGKQIGSTHRWNPSSLR